ncbi:MAG: hypothetical protein E3J78_07310 [Candidatus Cloacimonadota bacterium]|nr:MAG: hypothetical protein E3J78_07310 [Candidatus Cloacimonadota bacterium]
MFGILLKQLETICHEQGHYIQQLRDGIANRPGYLKDIQLIRKFESSFRIPDEILYLLNQQGCQFFYEFPLKDEKEHIKFFEKLYRLRKEDTLVLKEFTTPKNMLLQTYKNILQNDKAASLLFEIGYINKAGAFIKARLQNESGDILAKEILFMAKIIEILKTIRKELSGEYSIVTSFFSHFIDRFPYAFIIEHPLSDFAPLFLAQGFPLDLFREIHTVFLKYLSHKQSADILNEIKTRAFLTKDDLRKLSFSRFSFPQDDEFSILLKTIRKRAEKNETKLVKDDRELSLMDHRVSEQTRRIVKEKGQSIGEVIETKNKKPLLESSYRISEILTEIEKTCLDYIWHLKDFFNKSYDLSQKIEANHALKSLSSEELRALLEEEIYPGKEELIKLASEYQKVKPILDIDQSRIARDVIQKTLSLFNRIEREEMRDKGKIHSLLLKFREEGKRKYQPNVQKLLRAYKKTADELLLPLLICGLLQRNIIEWPLKDKMPSSQTKLQNEANYLGMYAIPKGKFYHFSRSGKINTSDNNLSSSLLNSATDICIKHFKKAVSVLIYDIRGSSFMTLKLHNAEREQMIIKNFHATMAKIAKEYGAFLLKDIGDGGIIWFGNNSKELYTSIYRESTTKKFKKLRHSLLSEEGLFLQSALNSSENAISCALSMIRAAEKFIKDNYVKYRDWFSDIQEKELIVEGTTYALLPPMFRSLFRLGIGISSGIPSRDVAIGPNAFGDPDLRGMLVNEAKYLSEGRDPEKSVILADHDSIFNLLFSTSKFTYGKFFADIRNKEDMMLRVSEIVKEKLKGGALNFSGKNFTAEPYEILVLESLKATKYTPSALKIDENGILYNDRGEKVKVLYSIVRNN